MLLDRGGDPRTSRRRRTRERPLASERRRCACGARPRWDDQVARARAEMGMDQSGRIDTSVVNESIRDASCIDVALARQAMRPRFRATLQQYFRSRSGITEPGLRAAEID